MSSPFVRRHIGPSDQETKEMLQDLGFSNLEDMVRNTVPASIRLKNKLSIPCLGDESDSLAHLKKVMAKNIVFKSYIGMGYSNTFTPPVILRNVLENPGWYTQYTPYQPEIAQGRLEALINFQTMIKDLTALEISNASLLDEGTAAAEAMSLAYHSEGDDTRNVFFVSNLCHPQTIEIVTTRAEPLGIKIATGDHQSFSFDSKIFGALLQYPATDGVILDYTKTIEKIHACGALAIVAADLLALTVLKAPGEMGADMAVGSAQRFGVPMGFGGPHAAYFATKDKYKRSVPGRIIGVSVDTQGKPAYRLALQTREQHIRREKATSNICTSQVLLAIMSSMYAVYHGPEGLKRIAENVHSRASILAEAIKNLGHHLVSADFFDTIKVQVAPEKLAQIRSEALKQEVNLRYFDSSHITISLDETTTVTDLDVLINIFAAGKTSVPKAADLAAAVAMNPPTSGNFKAKWAPGLTRGSSYLQHPVFNSFQSETEMLRYIFRLQSKDLSLAVSMIPLGSCTMKLNATSEMLPVTWNEVSNIHPFAPKDQIQGYLELFNNLESWLGEVTGFAGISLQPNAGSQGEYAGLLAIRKFHQANGQGHRNICLIPTSAHGTNPASAVMAGMKVVAVACDNTGNVDLPDLRLKADQHARELACIMITYPSTHGVFEEAIRDICEVIHSKGGQVYMDGANMNAQIGLCRPGDFGADVCHLNLHKTFSIPHGGGGPGMGPIGVKPHLIPHLPGHRVVGMGNAQSVGAISSAPWGSASVLTISWMYIAMMGAEGLTKATQMAILNANYAAKKLDPFFPVLYKGREGLVAHECIIDLRPLQEESGITVEDVAKRLMDYGYHAPTMSFPVAGTMMIEPTESESKIEIDRFCNALISIHGEILKVKSGMFPKDKNPLKGAPHTAQMVVSDKWDLPYSREVAAFPNASSREYKFWPSVGRVDNAYGDRNLFCSCPPWNPTS